LQLDPAAAAAAVPRQAKVSCSAYVAELRWLLLLHLRLLVTANITCPGQSVTMWLPTNDWLLAMHTCFAAV
jgi:hypothetical protein